MCIATSKNVSHANGNSNKRDADSQIKDVAMFPKVQRFLPLILSGYMFNTIAYAIVYVVLPFTGLNLTPAQEFCQNHNDNECTRRDLFTFQVVSFINLSYLGLLGFYTFFVSKRAYTALPRTSQGRILGNVSHVSGDGNGVLLPEADYVNIGIIIFQGWDFIASIFFEEHCTLIMMTHHLLAFSCGLFSLEYGLVPFYATYFGGVSEFSSIFLSIADIFKYFPASTILPPSSSVSSLLPTIALLSQVLFVLTFFVFRIIGWVYYSYLLLHDCKHAMKHKMIQQYSSGSTWFLWYLMSLSILLGCLQVFWFGHIVEKVLEFLAVDN